ncbi:nucleoside hydrolase [Paenibacillus filicis]|uniref:Nucleoside hydrolase n=1 Tax=Paenibacillus filicis TaxID=669464 RepID=A0ABU9DVD5_9BACL
MQPFEKKVIIDADTGIDDALAILYALKATDVHVEGITTVFGNISVQQATENTLRIIQLAKTTYEIPVVQGAEKPLQRTLQGFSTKVHGENGIGDVELPPSAQKALGEEAHEFILRKADELPNELIIVALGRLTNLAQALQKDATLAQKIKHVYVMGGAVHVPGNVTPVSEANIWGDPEAADIVFSSGLPITMVGLDVTMKTLITQQHLNYLQEHCQEENKDIVEFINESLQFYFDFYHTSNYWMGAAPLHDPLTMLVALEPGVVKTQQMKIKVECQSEICQGMTVADLRRNALVGSPVQVCIDVEAEYAVNKLLSVFL